MKSVDASLATSRRDRVPRTYLPFRNFRAYMQFRMSRRLHCARGRDSHRVPHRGARTDAAAYSGHPRPTDVHAVCGLGLCAALSYVTYVCYQRSQAGVGGVKAARSPTTGLTISVGKILHTIFSSARARQSRSARSVTEVEEPDLDLHSDRTFLVVKHYREKGENASLITRLT